MIRVANIVPQYGAPNEQYISDLISGVTNGGVESHVLASKYLGSHQEGVMLHHIRGRSSNYFYRTLLQISSYILKKKLEFFPCDIKKTLEIISPDIVHFHFGHITSGILNSIPFNVKICVSMHGYDGNVAIQNNIIKQSYYELINRNAVFIFPSGYFKNKFQKHLCVDIKGYVAGNPVDVDFFKDPAVKKNRSNISCIGRFIPVKNQIELIDSISELVKKGLYLHLNLIGFGPDECVLREKIKEYELSEYVTIHISPSKKEIRQILNDTSIYVQPSKKDELSGADETFCISVLEALAAKCFVVVRSGGAMEEVYSPLLSTGWTNLYSTREELQRIIEDLLRGAAGGDCRFDAVLDFIDSYSVDNISKKFLHIYKRV